VTVHDPNGVTCDHLADCSAGNAPISRAIVGILVGDPESIFTRPAWRGAMLGWRLPCVRETANDGTRLTLGAALRRIRVRMVLLAPDLLSRPASLTTRERSSSLLGAPRR